MSEIYLSVTGDRIYAQTPYRMKDRMQGLNQRKWDGELKCWHVPATPGAAAELHDAVSFEGYDSDDAFRALLAEGLGERGSIVHKDAADEDLAEIPGVMPAWLHQKRAYHFAMGRRGTMLAMDMGTGKSRTAISLLDGWASSLAVVLCPRKVVAVWPNQFAIHSDRGWSVITPPPNATVAKRAAYVAFQADVQRRLGSPLAIAVNYDAAWRPIMAELLKGFKAFTLILDESHRIKAPGGRASRYAAQLAERCDHVLALTGTPMPHSPMDLYGQFRAVDPALYGENFSRFRAKYAVMGGFEGRQVVGYQNTEDLVARFARASFVVKKDEAGLDLPKVVHVERKFDLTPITLKAYTTIDQDFVLGVGDGTVTAANALVKLLRLQQVTSGYVKDDDGEEHQIGTDKIDLLRDVLEDLPAKEPIVIFARFKHDLALIRELVQSPRQKGEKGGGGLGRRYGEVSGAVQDGHADYGLNEHSQMRDDLDVVALQIQSGGVGIDLTRSAYAIYYSLDFNLGSFDQSLARLDRPGQKRSVTYVHLVAEGTKDEVVYKALSERRDVVEAVIAASRRTDQPEEEAA